MTRHKYYIMSRKLHYMLLQFVYHFVYCIMLYHCCNKTNKKVWCCFRFFWGLHNNCFIIFRSLPSGRLSPSSAPPWPRRLRPWRTELQLPWSGTTAMAALRRRSTRPRGRRLQPMGRISTPARIPAGGPAFKLSHTPTSLATLRLPGRRTAHTFCSPGVYKVQNFSSRDRRKVES